MQSFNDQSNPPPYTGGMIIDNFAGGGGARNIQKLDLSENKIRKCGGAVSGGSLRKTAKDSGPVPLPTHFC